MNRSQKVRAIFVELKSVLGSQLKTIELLRLASAIVAAHRDQSDPIENDGYRTRDSFFSRPVDRAMQDGGWDVLYFEHGSGMQVWEDWNEFAYIDVKLVERFVGKTEWPRIETVWL